MIIASCGGDATSTREPEETGSSEPVAETPAAEAPTTEPAPSSSPTSTVDPAEEFNEAVVEAFRAGLALAELRLACLELTDLGCFLSNEQDIVAAERAVADALEAVGSASVAAGADVAACQNRIAETIRNNSSEWSSLLERATADGSGTKRFGEADWEYHRAKLGGELVSPGPAIANVLLHCSDVVNDPPSELMFWLGAFVESSAFARTAFSYNLLTLYLCVDQPPDPLLQGMTCFDSLGSPDDVGFGRGKLESAYEKIKAEPSYTDLPPECGAAIDEAMARLMSSLEIFIELFEREVISTDIEVQNSLSRGVFQIDDQRRGSPPMFPFDETMALNCAAAASEIS